MSRLSEENAVKSLFTTATAMSRRPRRRRYPLETNNFSDGERHEEESDIQFLVTFKTLVKTAISCIPLATRLRFQQLCLEVICLYFKGDKKRFCDKHDNDGQVDYFLDKHNDNPSLQHSANYLYLIHVVFNLLFYSHVRKRVSVKLVNEVIHDKEEKEEEKKSIMTLPKREEEDSSAKIVIAFLRHH